MESGQVRRGSLSLTAKPRSSAEDLRSSTGQRASGEKRFAGLLGSKAGGERVRTSPHGAGVSS